MNKEPLLQKIKNHYQKIKFWEKFTWFSLLVLAVIFIIILLLLRKKKKKKNRETSPNFRGNSPVFKFTRRNSFC